MSVYYEGEFDFTDVVSLQKQIGDTENVFAENFLKVGTQIESDYLPLLRQYPETRAKHPFQFATAKSRRYYFHLVKSGQVNTDGYGYVRSGGYADSWRVDVDQNGTVFSISVYSDFPASQYVGGLKQVLGHRNTGWIRYQPILADISTFMDTAVKRLV